MRMLAAALDGEVLVCMTEADYRALTGEGQVKPVDEILVRHAIDRMREVADELEGELPVCGPINLAHRGPTPEPVCLGGFSGPAPVAMDAGEPDVYAPASAPVGVYPDERYPIKPDFAGDVNGLVMCYTLTRNGECPGAINSCSAKEYLTSCPIPEAHRDDDVDTQQDAGTYGDEPMARAEEAGE
jgi:hypothetical protein